MKELPQLTILIVAILPLVSIFSCVLIKTYELELMKIAQFSQVSGSAVQFDLEPSHDRDAENAVEEFDFEPSSEKDAENAIQFDFEPSTGNGEEVERQLQMIRSLGDIADRDMHNWWAEYDQMMGNYTQIRNASICTDPDMLQARLNAIKTQVEKVCFLNQNLMFEFKNYILQSI